jgi:Pectate lyase superfamily protein
MNIPMTRLAMVAAIGTVALMAQAGLTSTSAAVRSPVALPLTHLSVHESVVHTAASATKGTTSSKRSKTAQVSAPAKDVLASVTSSGARCDGITDDTPSIQAAVDAAGRQAGGVVTIPAGICVLRGSIHLNSPNGVTVEGAGATKTFLVQHADSNIFQITSRGNTVEAMNLNTYMFNPGLIPIKKSPVPAVLFSNASNTRVMNITAETGSGFGMRLTGSNPCYAFPITGSVVSNVVMVNHGTGGFAAVDIDCQNGARLTNINIHGGILALYNDENTILDHEVYYGINRCQPAWFVTGPASNILIENVVTYAGAGVIHNSGNGVATGITVVNQTFASALHC